MNFTQDANERIDDAVDHVRSLQVKYGFSNDADSAAGAISESSELLGLELSDSEIAEACSRLLA